MALPRILRRFRNRLLSDPAFLAFAQRFPLTRWIARRKSSELFDIVAGFSYSQVLFACVQLGVFQYVGLQGRTLSELAGRINLPRDRIKVLVRAAVALGLLHRDGEGVALGPHGAAILGQPWIMHFIEHHAQFYRDLVDPVATLRGTSPECGLKNFWSYGDPLSDKSAYSDLMADSQAAVSAQVLAAYDFASHRRILDVGGGSGAFLRALGLRYPQLELNLFELPGVVPLARAATGPAILHYAGDFRSDQLPSGMDVISVVRVLHDHDDAAVLAILRNIRKACTPATVLLIAEPFSGHEATARVADAYFGLYFAAMGQGRTRTPAEIVALAATAGFDRPHQCSTHMPLITGLITLHPKAAIE